MRRGHEVVVQSEIGERLVELGLAVLLLRFDLVPSSHDLARRRIGATAEDEEWQHCRLVGRFERMPDADRDDSLGVEIHPRDRRFGLAGVRQIEVGGDPHRSRSP
jgi:hypothetical protein